MHHVPTADAFMEESADEHCYGDIYRLAHLPLLLGSYYLLEETG